MKSVVAYVRSLLGWCDEPQPIRTSFKRDRADDDLSSDDETPALKRLKNLKRTNFPDIMATNDSWEEEDNHSKNVRYVPIQIESHPSTSTPNVPSVTSRPRRERIIPIKLVGLSQNGPSLPSMKPRMHTPVRPVIHTVEDDENDEPDVTWVETKPANSTKKLTKVYIDLDDNDNDHNQEEDDVIFVKKVTTPPPTRPCKYFIAKNSHDVTDATEVEPVYYKLSRKPNDRSMLNLSPRTSTKFKAPPGITKPYKKPPTPLPKWMQAPKPTSNFSSYAKNRFLGLNGNTRSTLSEVFNLDEKKNYQELIRRVADSMKPLSFGRRTDNVSLAADAASVRLTQKTQKNALNELNLLQKGLIAEKDNDESKEYDPITVASINSSDSEIEVVPSESSTSSQKIRPINSLRDSYRDREVTSPDWLSKLDAKYNKKHQEIKEKVLEAQRECDIISKVNNAQKIAQLEHKLKYELRIPESLVVEPERVVEPEFPELSPEQLQQVKRALGPGPANQLLVVKFNLQIHRRDLQTLAGLNWLNDEVINFYMNLLMQRSEQRKDLPKVYATNTFFYPKLMQSGQPGLRRWTKKVDIFAYDLIVIPVHLNIHWCISMIDFRRRKIKYLDSMGGRNQGCLDALLQYLRDEHKDKKNAPFDETDWKCGCPEDIPQQMNGSDCGMFACTFAEFSARDAPYTFTQAHMPYLRRKAALEILTGKLLL